MITTSTTLYTTGSSTQDVIDGFLGNMSAGQVAADMDTDGVADALLNHCTEVDPQNYSEVPEEGDRDESLRTVPFTCADIAGRIVEMARKELEYA